MCCLPNKFPVPVILIATNLDKIPERERKTKLDEINFNSFKIENQFYERFFIGNTSNEADKENKITSDKDTLIINDFSVPFDIITRFSFEFDDIKAKFFGTGNVMKSAQSDSHQGGKKTKCIIY